MTRTVKLRARVTDDALFLSIYDADTGKTIRTFDQHEILRALIVAAGLVPSQERAR